VNHIQDIFAPHILVHDRRMRSYRVGILTRSVITP